MSSEALQAAFESEALRQGFNARDPWVARYVDYEWSRLRHVLQAYDLPGDGGRVLEFGCNVGASAIVLAALGAKVSAVDVDPKAVAVARANAARYGANDIRFFDIAGDAALPFEGGAFDLVVCNSVLEYVPHRRLPGVLDEIVRVLRPGGHLLIVGTSSRLWPREMHSRRWFVQWLPRAIDSWLGIEVQRGIGPVTLRRLLGARVHDVDLDDGGQAWLRARGMFNGGAAPRSARLMQRFARLLRIGPGWLTPSLSALLVKHL